MSGLIIAGWFPGKRARKARPTMAIVTTQKPCEFCHNDFACTGRRDRVRRTCTVFCAGRLRSQFKQRRAVARFKAAHAAKWLTFPKEEVFDG